MYSFGFQQAFQRGIQPGDHVFFTKCLDAARSVIRSMIEDLAPSGYMRYAPDGHFVFASFASAFLLKLLRPEFSHFMSRERETEVFDLINTLIQTLSSSKIAIDDRHTPKLYARFLAGLLGQHRRGGPTTGRLHPQPPPQNQIPGGSGLGYSSHASSASHQSTFSISSQPHVGDQQSHQQSRYRFAAKGEPVYRPDASFALGSGVIEFDSNLTDGTSPNYGVGQLDEDALAAMQTLKSPSFWQTMMMPGFSWPEPQPTHVIHVNNDHAIPALHSFNFQASEVPLC